MSDMPADSHQFKSILNRKDKLDPFDPTVRRCKTEHIRGPSASESWVPRDRSASANNRDTVSEPVPYHPASDGDTSSTGLSVDDEFHDKFPEQEEGYDLGDEIQGTKALQRSRSDSILDGLTPLNTPYTPLSLRQFMNVRSRDYAAAAAEGGKLIVPTNISHLASPEKMGLLRWLSAVSPARNLWFIVNASCDAMFPVRIVKSDLFVKMKDLIICCFILTAIVPMLLVLVPSVFTFLVLTTPVWMIGCLINGIRLLISYWYDSEAKQPQDGNSTGNMLLGVNHERYGVSGSFSRLRKRYHVENGASGRSL